MIIKITKSILYINYTYKASKIATLLFFIVVAAIVSMIFFVPILFNMAFGGGDIRFGIFAAPLVGLEGIGHFIIF